MTWILNSNLTNPIEDTAPFRDADGTSYPGNWDKSTIPGMAEVAAALRPDDALNIVTGSHVEMIADVPTQVWDATLRPAEDLKARANTPILAQIEAKEKKTFRPMRELRRAQEFADVPAADVTAAKNQIKTLDDDIKALRTRLQ